MGMYIQCAEAKESKSLGESSKYPSHSQVLTVEHYAHTKKMLKESSLKKQKKMLRLPKYREALPMSTTN